MIWRGFRLWAALDGVDAPENLPSCISVHHSLASFWRSWHASFNQWLVRYLYVPLGGRARSVATSGHAAFTPSPPATNPAKLRKKVQAEIVSAMPLSQI